MNNGLDYIFAALYYSPMNLDTDEQSIIIPKPQIATAPIKIDGQINKNAIWLDHDEDTAAFIGTQKCDICDKPSGIIKKCKSDKCATANLCIKCSYDSTQIGYCLGCNNDYPFRNFMSKDNLIHSVWHSNLDKIIKSIPCQVCPICKENIHFRRPIYYYRHKLQCAKKRQVSSPYEQCLGCKHYMKPDVLHDIYICNDCNMMHCQFSNLCHYNRYPCRNPNCEKTFASKQYERVHFRKCQK